MGSSLSPFRDTDSLRYTERNCIPGNRRNFLFKLPWKIFWPVLCQFLTILAIFRPKIFVWACYELFYRKFGHLSTVVPVGVYRYSHRWASFPQKVMVTSFSLPGPQKIVTVTSFSLPVLAQTNLNGFRYIVLVTCLTKYLKQLHCSRYLNFKKIVTVTGHFVLVTWKELHTSFSLQ
jgi:hypothetical protein